MAARPQNMHDGGIMERRLRPIYDWLDNGNNKKALQEAEKVLKKSPSLQPARALKALALLRLGRNSEAHTVLDALAEEKPSDDTTLQAVTICYRESQELQKVCALYENAVNMEPTSEELHSHLFMSYVRVGDHRAQQKAAMALYKFTSKNPYYFWAVMSIVLQAKNSEDSTKRGILLTLAQRMIDNFISENKMEAEQEARLYIMILELQDKWTDIIKFIETPLYSRLVPGSVPQSSLQYLQKLSQWKKLNLLSKELLMDNPDRWDYYVPYFDSVFQLIKGTAEGVESETNVDDTAEKCHEFICLLVESMGTSRMLRGPFIARLELWKRLSVDGNPTALMGSGVALCVDYLRMFGHKPCAIPDLKPYLSMLPQAERELHSTDFLTCLGFDETSCPVKPDDIQRHVNCLGAWRLVAGPLGAAESARLAAVLRRHYLRCLRERLLASTLTEFGAPDMYALLAAHHYVYAALELKDSKPAMEALCLLELVLHKSPANFHAKLLLIRIYHLLGNGFAADTVYTRLEVKHVQLVSMCWVHAARLAPACCPVRAAQLASDTRAFHDLNTKDSVEHITFAYKYGTWGALCELTAWGARLAACAGGGVAAREKALLSVLAGTAPPLYSPHRPHKGDYTDNRDLNVIIDWRPPQCHDAELKSRTMAQEVDYLTLKDSLVSALSLCAELCDSRPAEGKRKQHDDLKATVTALDKDMELCRRRYQVEEEVSIATPFPSRIIAFVNSPVPYRELYTALFPIVAELAAGSASAAHPACVAIVPALDGSQAALRRAVADRLCAGDPVWHMREALEHISNYIEFIGIITYILGLCNELVTPRYTKKSKKKANKSPDEVKTSELLNKVNEAVQTCISTVEQIFETWPEYVTNKPLEEEFEELIIQESYTSPVESKLKNGRNDMIRDLNDILSKKSKFLKGLMQQ